MKSNHKNTFGKDCPKGMVQIEFVGVDPKLKRGNYGWAPSKSAFIEVYVDGERYRIDVGDVIQGDGSMLRGIHVNGPMDLIVNRTAINSADLVHPHIRDGSAK